MSSEETKKIFGQFIRDYRIERGLHRGGQGCGIPDSMGSVPGRQGAEGIKDADVEKQHGERCQKRRLC